MRRRIIIILILTSIFIKSHGQKADLFNTKDLLKIVDSTGLSSAIGKLDWYPIQYIDRKTTNLLLKQTMKEPYSHDIERFLLNLTLNEKLVELAEPINHLIYLKTKLAIESSPEKYDEINIDGLPSILINANARTEKYLKKYYDTWLNLAKKSRANYILGKNCDLKYNSDSLNIPLANKIYDLMRPYKVCNYNCYVILLTLKKMRSQAVDNKILLYHQQIGETQKINISIFKYEKGNTFLKNKAPIIIKLYKKYKTIKDIDFANELNFKNRYLKQMNSDFAMSGFYNRNKAIINICWDGCNYYLIKLIDSNKLQIYQTTMFSTTTNAD